VNSLYRPFLAVIVVSLVIPIVAVIYLCTINLKPTLLPLEKEVLGFSFFLPPSFEREDNAFHDLKNPVDTGANEYPPVALTELAPAQGSPTESTVSLIVLGKAAKLAVIKGVVVKEGDAFQGDRVARIEKDRVLLKNGKEEKWLVAK
jgi:hypothetical protein